MASVVPPAEPMQIEAAPDYAITRTLPDELLRHDISDDELDMLCESRRDNVWEGMWVALGALIGGLPSTISSVGSYLGKDDDPLALADLAQIIIFFVALALSVVLWLVCSRRTKRASAKQTEIRDRSRRIKG